MEHSFNIEMAAKYGIAAAILYRHFQFWIVKNRADGRHFHDGRTWSYNTRKGLCGMFPYLGEGRVRAGIKKLVDAGILRTGNYNRRGFDRTLWFAFEDEKTAFLGLPAHWLKSPMENQVKKPIGLNDQCIGRNSQCIGKNSQPIPDKTTDIKNKDKTSPVLSLADAKPEGLRMLTQEGVHPKVATAIVLRQKHPPESIHNAIANAHSRQVWLSVRDQFRAKMFKIAGYIVASLNTARREGHTVKLSKRSRAIKQLARDHQTKRQSNIGEKETGEIRQKQLKELGIV